MKITLNKKGDALLAHVPYEQNALARNIPSRQWLKSVRAWKCAPSLANVEYLSSTWPDAEWDPGALQAKEDALQRAAMRGATLKAKEDGDLSQLDDTPFKHTPFDHQKKALLLGRDTTAFAYLMDQGTGKTKVALDDAAYNWREDRIDAMVIIAPNSVKTNWVNFEGTDEVSEHMAPDVDYIKAVWFSSPSSAQKKHFNYFLKKVNDPRYLKVISLNVESLSVSRVQDFLVNFCNAFKVMLVIDESTRIKTPGSKRTKFALKLAKLATLRRILTGTPIIKAPENAYAQFKFLDSDILGQDSFYSFRNRYCIMGGFEARKIVGYNHMDELSERIASVSYRVLKTDCLDLPPKMYEKRMLKLSPKQGTAYIQMKKDMVVALSAVGDCPACSGSGIEFVNRGDGVVGEIDCSNCSGTGQAIVVKAPIVLTQLMRLQEIVGGYLPQLDEFGDRVGTIELVPARSNPKIQECISIIEEAGDQKIIIWARFRAEIEGILSELSRHEISCVAFHGGITESDRVRARKAFQAADGPQVFVGNPAAGGIGIDLWRASIAIYFSNSFSTEERVQSEDRCHRIGSGIHDSVTYYDLICTGTVDTRIISTLRNNKKISDEIMRDGWKEWI